MRYHWEMTGQRDDKNAYDDKPILCVDFDGVLHDSRGIEWEGADIIKGPPIKGAAEWLKYVIDEDFYDVHVFSSRSHQLRGVTAIKEYVFMMLVQELRMGLMEAGSYINKIYFPKVKPPAQVALDDRGIHFTGEFPDMETLKAVHAHKK